MSVVLHRNMELYLTLKSTHGMIKTADISAQPKTWYDHIMPLLKINTSAIILGYHIELEKDNL